MGVCKAKTFEFWKSSRSGYNESKIPQFGTAVYHSMSILDKDPCNRQSAWTKVAREGQFRWDSRELKA